MEKYTKWRDAGTGVAPFLPVSPPELTSTSLPLRILLSIIKFPLIILFGLLFLVVDSWIRFSLGNVSKQTFEIVRSSVARILLFVCGFHRISVSYDTRKVKAPRAGDVVIVNQSSPIDILLLVYLYPSAVFTTSSDEMLFRTQSASSAFFSRFSITSGIRTKGVPINDLLRKSKAEGRVVLISPERTTSNNRGLLAFCPIMLNEAFVLSIKYNNPPYLSTPIPNQYWDFFWSLTSVWQHECRLKGSSQKIEVEFAETIAKYARIPKTNLGIDDKVEFLKAWARREKTMSIASSYVVPSRTGTKDTQNTVSF